MRRDRPARPARPARPLGRLRALVDIALLALLAVGLSGLTLGRVLPALGHPVYVVAGPSMEPAIGVGAAVVLESAPASDLRVGDVVSLRSGPARAVFTHRITRLADRDGEIWLQTKGDANPDADPSLTPASAVVGRVRSVLPGAGYVLTVLSAPAGVLFVLSTGALLLLLGWWLESIARDGVVRARSVVVVAPAPGARARRSAARRTPRRPTARPASGLRRA